MIYLLQILNSLNSEQLELFESLFNDVTFEIEEMGWTHIELTRDMLDNHFGLYIEDDKQLKMLSDTLQKPDNLKSALNVTRLKRAT